VKTKKQIREEAFQRRVEYEVRRQEEEDRQFWSAVSKDPNWRMSVITSDGKGNGIFDNRGRRRKS